MKKFWIISGIVLFILLIVAILYYKNRKFLNAQPKSIAKDNTVVTPNANVVSGSQQQTAHNMQQVN